MGTSHSLQAFGRIARLAVFLILVVSTLTAVTFASADKIIYSFLGPPDGMAPSAGLVADSAGNLYGTTIDGGIGTPGPGVVFELSPPAAPGGAWTETVLHSFGFPQILHADGSYPSGTLAIDKAGNLYGTTDRGGDHDSGIVFELSPPPTPGAAWTYTVIWDFPDPTAARPYGKLVMDAKGNLYGTSSLGGTNHNAGAVFELVAPATPGKLWTEKVLYNFYTNPGDGGIPGPDLLLHNGVFYGTGQIAGYNGSGAVFQLVNKAGVWTESTIHEFTGTDGMDPYGGLIADPSGDLFGMTVNGGDTTDCAPLGCGTIYELSPPAVAGGTWEFSTLHVFTKNGDGANPWGALWRDAAGNLYGTAYAGGANGRNLGTVFKLKPPATASGEWTFAVLHSFTGLPLDGGNPHGTLMLHNGALFGTTMIGGKKYGKARSGGTVFSIVP